MFLLFRHHNHNQNQNHQLSTLLLPVLLKLKPCSLWFVCVSSSSPRKPSSSSSAPSSSSSRRSRLVVDTNHLPHTRRTKKKTRARIHGRALARHHTQYTLVRAWRKNFPRNKDQRERIDSVTVPLIIRRENKKKQIKEA